MSNDDNTKLEVLVLEYAKLREEFSKCEEAYRLASHARTDALNALNKMQKAH